MDLVQDEVNGELAPEDEAEDQAEDEEELADEEENETDGSSDDSSDVDVRVVGEKRSALNNGADGIAQQGSRSLDNAPAAQKAKPSILSPGQHTFMDKFMPASAKIDGKRQMTVRHVKGRGASAKE